MVTLRAPASGSAGTKVRKFPFCKGKGKEQIKSKEDMDKVPMPLTPSLNINTHPGIKHCARVPHPALAASKVPSAHSVCTLFVVTSAAGLAPPWHQPQEGDSDTVLTELSWLKPCQCSTPPHFALGRLQTHLSHCTAHSSSQAHSTCYSRKEVNPSNVRTLEQPQLCRDCSW